MMYVFESSDGLVYNTPDAFILDQKNQIVEWGTKLRVYPLYKKGNRSIGGYQEIQAMFFHEGNFGGPDGTYWQPTRDYEDWYKPDGNVKMVENYKVISLNLGSDCPKYFLTKKDLSWYIENIYDLYQPFVIDEYQSE